MSKRINQSWYSFSGEKLSKLAHTIIINIQNPRQFEDKTGFKQDEVNIVDLIWIEFLENFYKEENTSLVFIKSLRAKLKPLVSTRLGGNVTVMHANNYFDNE